MNWEQLKTIFWLRWRLTRNQWQRAGGFGAALVAIAAVAAVILGGAAFVGGLLGAALGLGKVAPEVVMEIWFGVTVVFLFFWVIGLLAELQRSETIDLQRLMHLPVAIGQMFSINFVASHLSLSIILFLPGMTGLAIGLAFARGPAMLLLLPLAWSMVFMISAWTYCLRGWLATLMSNPRRRRGIIMGITFSIILVVQLPNLYINVLGGRKPFDRPKEATPEEVQRNRAAREAKDKETFNQLIAVQKFIPPLWLPYGALGLAEQRVLPALLGTFGCLGLGVLGLRRAYRTTVKFYQGEVGGQAAAPVVASATTATASPAMAGKSMLELRLPVVPEQAAAVALGTFRSMLRAPEVKMAWGMSFIVTVIFAASVFWRAAPKIPTAAKPFIVVGAMGFSLFMLMQFLANQFGFDRQGFRAFVLSPVERRLILLGKNLATWPVSATSGLLVLAMVSFWLRLPLLVAMAAVFQLASLLLLWSMAGNLFSILMPFRIQAGTMKPTKMPALTMLMMVLCQLLLPVVAMVPVMVPALLEWLWRLAGWPVLVPVNLILSVLLATLMAILYWRSLEPLGRLLQRREIRILNIVTAEQE